MATFTASIVQVTSRAVISSGTQTATMPVPDLSTATRLTNLTTSGTSGIVQSGGSDWESPGCIVTICCDGAVNIAAGSAPTAAATAGIYVPANVPREVTISKGHKLAVVDA